MGTYFRRHIFFRINELVKISREKFYQTTYQSYITGLILTSDPFLTEKISTNKIYIIVGPRFNPRGLIVKFENWNWAYLRRGGSLKVL